MAGYREGVHDLGNGAFAYLQDCNKGSGWGWSNSGLIKDHEESLLVDTLRDENLTRTMLNGYRDATGLDARQIGTLVNTHRDGDHTYGNRLMSHARIVASEACARQLRERLPSDFVSMLRNRPQGVIGDFIFELFGPPFEFEGIEPTIPNDTFTGQRDLKIGDKTVHLTQVGPAHTDGDVLVHVPANRIVYTGDIVFLTNTPVIWAGPHENWIRALDLILGMDIDTVVPGHGPITDKGGVIKVKEYIEFIERQSRLRFDAGLSVEDAIRDISLGEFEDWGGAERIVPNVLYFYRRFGGGIGQENLPQAMALMAPYAMRARKRSRIASTPA